MSKQHPTIMVVEDETLLLQAITKKFKLSGLDVISCASGQQALDYLQSIDELPDAISLDYYLKDMNGLAFMQQLKDNPKWADIPVVVVSNSASPDKVSTMLGLGAKKYILKAEYRLDEIIKMILEFINDGAPAETSATGGIPGAVEIDSGGAPAPAAPAPAATPPSTPTASATTADDADSQVPPPPAPAA